MSSTGSATTVAVLGTGVMGAGMAGSLLRAGFGVRVWNRTRARAEPLAARGASVAGTAAEAVRGADVVLVMLFDADAVVEVISGAAGASGPGTVWLQASTIGVEGTARVAALAAERGLSVLDTPVLGTREPAEQGRLVVLLSGAAAAAERVAPVLDALGSRTVRVGERLGQASALKLACNAWVATLTAALGQSMTLAGALGLDPALFLEAISGGPVDAPYAHAKARLIQAGEFPVSFAVDGVVKDVGLMLAAADRSGVDTTLLRAVLAVFERTSRAGRGGQDMAAVATAFGHTG